MWFDVFDFLQCCKKHQSQLTTAAIQHKRANYKFLRDTFQAHRMWVFIWKIHFWWHIPVIQGTVWWVCWVCMVFVSIIFIYMKRAPYPKYPVCNFLLFNGHLTVNFSKFPQLLQINTFSILPGGILHTVAGCQPYRWLQFGLWTKMALSLRHSANTSPPM